MVDTEIKSAVTAVVVNHNGGQAPIRCLDALAGQTLPIEKVIVVDNASTDGSPAAISAGFPDVELIRLPTNVGLSRARNIGLRQAASRLVLIIDDDVYVDGSCVWRLRETLERRQAAVVCPRIVFWPERQTIQCDGAAPHFTGTLLLESAGKPLDGSADIVDVQACIGACMLLDRESALATGGFDEQFFFYFEDLEFSLRMRALGYDILCDRGALVFHDRGQGTPQLSFRGTGAYPERRVFLNIRNRLMTILLHFRPRTLIMLFPALLAYELATLAIIFKRGWQRPWLNALKSVYDARAYVIKRRSDLARHRLRSDKELLSGGELPLAKGFIDSPGEKLAVNLLSSSLNAYWKVVKPLIG